MAILAGVSLLAEARPVTTASMHNRAAVFLLKSDVETSIRNSPTNNGCRLNDHFLAHSASSWRCWPVDAGVIANWSDGRLSDYINVEAKHANAIGIEPEIIDSLNDVIPNAFGSAAEPSANDSGGPVAPVQHDILHPLPDVKNCVNGAVSSFSLHVHSIAKPRLGGVVTHTYEPYYILKGLLFKSNLRPAASISDALQDAVPFFLPREVCEDARREISAAQLPSENIMREARIRLDLLATAFEAQEFHRYHAWVYVNPDASPQLGWNWMASRVDTFKWSKDEFDSIDKIMASDFNQAFASRTDRLATIGRGHGTTIHKAMLLATTLKVASTSRAQYIERRAQVFGVLTDQGHESGAADMDDLEAKGASPEHYTDEKARMYPNALWLPEFLHILFNALEHAVERLPNHKTWLAKLRHISNFIADQSLRRLFVHTCVPWFEQSFFQSYSVTHIDWCWEVLVAALDELIPRFGIMRARMDVEKLMMQPDGKVEANVIREAHAALHTPQFLELSMMIRTTGHILQKKKCA